MPKPSPIVIDTDVGADPDDALALLLALASPEVDLLGVTVVDGDVDLRARMASRLLGMAGRLDVPVVKGRRRPLGPGRGPTMLGTEGQGLLDIDYGGSEARVLDAPAPEWLAEASRRAPFHLVGIGPPTNVAAALRLDPGFARRVIGLTIMGGVLGFGGFPPAWQRAIRDGGLDPATFDHNTASDTEAALICARSGIPTTWVPIEVTLQAPLRRVSRDRFRDAGSRLGLVLARMLDTWHERWFRSTLPESNDMSLPPIAADAVAFLHDPLTVAALFPGDWARLRRISLRSDIAAGLFHLREADQAPRVATAVARVDGPTFEQFCVERIVRLLMGTARGDSGPERVVPVGP